MKFMLVEENLKIFAKGLQFLSRLSDVIYFETTETGLHLKSVNSQKSSYAIITLFSKFFVDFSRGYDADNVEENSCKIATKPLLKTFRNFKNVQQALISLDNEASKFVVKYKYGQNASRTHRIRVLDNDFLNANCSRDDYTNQLFSSPKTFSNIAKTFQLNEDEITFKVSERQVIINNYEAALSTDQRIMKSQMTMCLSEFNRHSITEETSITFCFREFRAFLVIASYLRLNVSMNFQTTGKPVSFTLKRSEMFDVNLIMSTVSDVVRAPLKSRSRANSKFNSSSTKRKNQMRNENSKWKKRKTGKQAEKSLLDDGNDDVFSQLPIFKPWKTNPVISGESQMPSLNISKSASPTTASSVNAVQLSKSFIQPVRARDISPTISSYSPASASLEIARNSANNAPILLSTDTNERALANLIHSSIETESEKSPLGVFNRTNLHKPVDTESEDIQLIFQDDSDQNAPHFDVNVEIIPNSPEHSLPPSYHRRTRHIFKRCFESTFNPNTLAGSSQVLAEDSDPE